MFRTKGISVNSPSSSSLAKAHLTPGAFQELAKRSNIYQHDDAFIFTIDSMELLCSNFLDRIADKTILEHDFINTLKTLSDIYGWHLYFYSPNGKDFFMMDNVGSCGSIKYFRQHEEDLEKCIMGFHEGKAYVLNPEAKLSFEPKPEDIIMTFEPLPTVNKNKVLLEIISDERKLIPLTYRKTIGNILRISDTDQYLAVVYQESARGKVIIGKDNHWRNLPVDRIRIMRDHCGDKTVFFKEDCEYKVMEIPSSHGKRRKQPHLIDAHNKRIKLTTVNLKQGEKIGLHQDAPQARHTPMELFVNKNRKGFSH